MDRRPHRDSADNDTEPVVSARAQRALARQRLLEEASRVDTTKEDGGRKRKLAAQSQAEATQQGDTGSKSGKAARYEKGADRQQTKTLQTHTFPTNDFECPICMDLLLAPVVCKPLTAGILL